MLPLVTAVEPCELVAALRVLFAPCLDTESQVERCLDAITSGELDAAGLLVIRDDGGVICGAALAQVLPGALGVVWPPRADTIRGEDVLCRGACDWLRLRGVKVCQASASAGEVADMAALERSGFRHVTQVVLMRRDVDATRDAEVWDGRCSPLRVVAYSPGNATEFNEILLATHRDSLDCPELGGERTVAEILDGFHRDAGNAERDWLLLQRKGDPHDAVGVLMFDISTESNAREIAYLGLIPAARGHGFGDELVRIAINEATREEASLTLSVDSRNAPALRLYRRHGFVETDRREVWLAHICLATRST